MTLAVTDYRIDLTIKTGDKWRRERDSNPRSPCQRQWSSHRAGRPGLVYVGLAERRHAVDRGHVAGMHRFPDELAGHVGGHGGDPEAQPVGSGIQACYGAWLESFAGVPRSIFPALAYVSRSGAGSLKASPRGRLFPLPGAVAKPVARRKEL